MPFAGLLFPSRRTNASNTRASARRGGSPGPWSIFHFEPQRRALDALAKRDLLDALAVAAGILDGVAHQVGEDITASTLGSQATVATGIGSTTISMCASVMAGLRLGDDSPRPRTPRRCESQGSGVGRGA